MNMHSRIRKPVAIFLSIVALFIVLFFSFRNTLLNMGINKVSKEIKLRTGGELSIKTASFSGLTSVALNDISMTPARGDTLLTADTVNICISFWPIFIGTIRLKEIYASGVVVTLSSKDSVWNYKSFLSEKRTSTTTTVSTGRNYAIMIKGLFERAFNFAPQRASLNDVSFIYRTDKLERKINISSFKSDETSLGGTAQDMQTHSVWKCSGSFSQADRSLQLDVFPEIKDKPLLPLAYDVLGLAICFDNIHIGVNGSSWTRNIFTTNGDVSVSELSIFHKKISTDTVKVPSASFNYVFHSGKTYMEIDSASLGLLGDIRFTPFLKYSNEGNKEFSFHFKTDNVSANNFFTSLPQGMFDEVRDLRAEGSLKFELDFKINTSQPDSLLFESSFTKQKFRLRKFGDINLLKLNDEFIHSVYEGDRYIRSFPIGPSNSTFASLDNISPYFRNAVLTSEDGNFYFHNGFNEDAFRKSIISNFKAGKFVRGGSTISMQLVKNVFLNRKKTIARKAEEALLVWLIENNRLCSKDRMLEVYMNIIELGPGVYGIGEASTFYFSKKPIQLNLPESVFLASLLPHPKWFKYSFDTLGNLKPYLADYYRNVSDFMLKKSLITQEEHDALQPHVVLTGPAREMVIPSDTIPESEDPDD